MGGGGTVRPTKTDVHAAPVMRLLLALRNDVTSNFNQTIYGINKMNDYEITCMCNELCSLEPMKGFAQTGNVWANEEQLDIFFLSFLSYVHSL
jgi:hypothetical protein